MTYLNNTSCCAVDEINGIDEKPKDVLISICDEKYGGGDSKQAFIIFTDNVTEYSHGENLAKYIKKNKLGSLQVTRARKNPNSGNLVKVWIWTPNERKLKMWYKALW